jgi:hypothetical protein
MKNRKNIAESETAAVLVEWLITSGWEVYQEVQFAYGGPRADIIAIKRDPKIAWVIEVKNSMCGKVIGQAMRWQWEADMASIAVLKSSRNSKARELNKTLCERKGIGILSIDTQSRRIEELMPAIEQVDHSRYGFRHHERFFELPEEFKTYCSAGTQGGYLTPYRATCDRILAYAREHPGTALSEIVKAVGHHYASDAGAVGTLGRWGIHGCELKTCVFPKDAERNDTDGNQHS